MTEEQEQLYKNCCHLLVSSLIVAGQAAKTLRDAQHEWDWPQFCPDDIEAIDIDDPFSTVNRLIRSAISQGIMSNDDPYLLEKPYSPAPNYRAALA